MTLPNEVVELLRKAATHPEGAAPLFEGNLESVASLYQVHPTRVEQVRGWLSNAQLFQESQQIIAATRPMAHPAAAAVAARDAEAVIAEAMALPNGMELLTEAPVETAAVLLGVHPFVIDEARVRLAGKAPAGVVNPVRPSSPRFIGRPS